MIQVHDEASRKTQYFRCDKSKLLAGMKYFEKYFMEQSVEEADDVDIAVHCDIQLFDWLMRYVHGLEPKFEVK